MKSRAGKRRSAILRQDPGILLTRDDRVHLAQRPAVRGDCDPPGRNGGRPCPWVGCKHHLYLDVNPDTGSIKVNFPNVDPLDMSETCALDVADRGGVTLEEVGEIMNLTRERVRQIEVRGVLKMRANPVADDD